MIDPEDTYEAFFSKEPIKSVARHFGVGYRILRRWWCDKFGEAALVSRGREIQAAAARQTCVERRKTLSADGLKQCTRCRQRQVPAAFSKRKSSADGLAPWCLTCSREYQRTRNYKRAALSERRRLLDSLKERSCADCGGTYPSVVMDFDHVRGDKTLNVSQMVGWRIERLMAEVAKCEVVCANCHRLRTHYRRSKKVE